MRAMTSREFLEIISMAVGDSQTLIALDLGGKTGWAMWRDGVVTSGTIDLTKSKGKRFEGPGMKFVRFARFLKKFPHANCVSFEEVRRHRGVAAAHAYGGYLSHLTAFCDVQAPQIPYEGIAVGTIKKRATGNGSATKEMMIDACCGKLGIVPVDDNEADAAWILVLMVEAEGLEWPGGPVEQPPEKPKKKKRKKAKKAKKA
jgi:hypothetical protein